MKKKDNNNGLLIGLGLGVLFFSMKGKGATPPGGDPGGDPGNTGNKNISEAMLIEAFQKAKSTFGEGWARKTEQIYRKETRHFDSLQFLKCYTPGMEATKNSTSFPWGWSSLNEFLTLYPQYNGNFYLVPMKENGTGILKRFISFPTLEGAVMFVTWLIQKRGRAGYWRAFDNAIATRYEGDLAKINTHYV